MKIIIKITRKDYNTEYPEVKKEFHVGFKIVEAPASTVLYHTHRQDYEHSIQTVTTDNLFVDGKEVDIESVDRMLLGVVYTLHDQVISLQEILA